MAVFHHAPDQGTGNALAHAPTQQARIPCDSLPVAFRHDATLMQDDEGERRTVVILLVHERFRQGFQTGPQGGIAQGERPRIAGLLEGQRELLRLQFVDSLPAQQRDAVPVPVHGRGLCPEETARHGLVLIVHLVLIELDEGEVEVQRLHVGLIPSGDEHRRGEVLGSIPRDDGHEGIQIQASADESGREQTKDRAENGFPGFRFHGHKIVIFRINC